MLRTAAWTIALWTAMAAAQQPQSQLNAADRELPTGLVVESVRKGGAAALAGIQPGDTLLRWSLGPSSGELTSPFDLGWVEAEQAPRGPVILTGHRGNEQLAWTMQPGSWEVDVRPNMEAPHVTLHQEALELISREKTREAAETWRRLNEMAPENPSWLRLWIKARAGKELYQARDTEDAIGFYVTAAEGCAPAGTEVCRQILMLHANSAYNRGDFVSAQKYAQLAVEKARAQESPLALAATLHFVGLQRANRGDSARAKEVLDEALKIQQELSPNSTAIARTLQDLSLVAINSNDLVAGEQTATQSLNILEHVAPKGQDLLWSLELLAMVAGHREDRVQQERYLRWRLTLVSEGENDPGMLASSLTELAFVLHKLGDLHGAERYASQALALVEANERENRDKERYAFARTLTLMGLIEAEDGNWQQAEAHLLRGLTIAEKFGPKSLLVIGQLEALLNMFTEKKDFVQAMQYCRRAHETAVRLDPGGAHVYNTDYYCGHAAWKLGLVSEAETYFSEAAAWVAFLGPGTMEEADASAGLARIRWRQGRFGESKVLFEKALHSMDASYARLGGGSQARAGYRAELMEYYSDYIDFLMERGDPVRAFEVLELSRARALLELLNSAHVDLAKGSDPSLLENLRRLQRQISAKSEERTALLTSKASEIQVKALEKEISALAAEAGEMEGRIRSASPAYAAMTNPRTLSVRGAQELLDPDTLLLEYALGAERSYVFAVSADSLRAFPLPARDEIDRAARRIYSLLSARNQIVPGEPDMQREGRLRRAQEELPAALEELGRMVLGPLSGQLGNKRLIVAADGALNYIPFAMLPEISPNSKRGRSATPLVARHEIVNLPSISVLAVLRRQRADRPPAGKAVAVFADPVFEKTDSRIKQPGAGGKVRVSETGAYSLSANLLTRSAGDFGLSHNGQLNLPRLLFSRQEAEAIRAVTPPGQIKEAVDFQASRSAATSPELRNYRIVHFATHGLLNSGHPELSGLVLSLVDEHGQPQDGFLQLQDIYSLDLSADLVVLSACETGLGKEINGEGLIGLTRGFMYAGASRVVASLWKVSDAATAKLMAEFYRAMEKDHMPPAAALRAAQIHMWKQKRWTSPYFWAAFQIQGEWK
ncbi:MAG TPA: CHAT domain-containing protein [Candidatus Angelobacter sp.]